MKKLLQKNWFKNSMIVLMCVAAVYSLIYADVLLRARYAYLQGEKYWSWYLNPKLKEKELDEEFLKEKSKLDKKQVSAKILQEEYNKQLDILKFNHEQKMQESSIKYAYIWYQTVIELFSPPESKWVKLSREKMPEAKKLWKQELIAKNIPFEDYMLE